MLLMEPSEIFGGNEECHSSESGWTMYIGSPIQGGGDDDDDDNDHEADGVYAADDGDYADETGHAYHEAAVDSDDSMASDASSGPSHQGQFYGNMERGHGVGTSHFKHVDEGEGEGDCYLDKKAKKLMEKQKLGTKKKEDKKKEQVMTFEAKEARTPRSSSNLRKSIWLGKRK